MDFQSAYHLANESFVEEMYDQALDHYGTAVLLDDTNSDAYTKRAQCHIKMNKYKEALEDAKKAITLKQDNARAYLRQGIAQYYLNDFNGAQMSFSKGLSFARGEDVSTYSEWLKRSVDSLVKSSSSTAKAAPTKPATPSASAQAPPPIPAPTSKPTSTNQPITPAPASTPTAKPEPTPAKPEPTPAKPEPTPAPTAPKVRHEWYQNDAFVIVTIFAKNTNEKDVHITFEEQNLDVSVKLTADNSYGLEMDLANKIVPKESSFSVSPAKIEIKLKKADPVRWSTLEAPAQVAPAVAAPASSGKNWDKILKDEGKEDEKSEMGFLRSLYENAGEEEKRAIAKSMEESGGTVLNMNWGDVANKKVKAKPSEWSRVRPEDEAGSDSDDDEHWGGKRMSADEKRRAEETARMYHERQKQQKK